MKEFLIFMPLAVVIVFGLFGNITMRWSKTYRKFACWIGWHSYPSFNVTKSDNYNTHACCKWCGYKGMIDSQGNLF